MSLLDDLLDSADDDLKGLRSSRERLDAGVEAGLLAAEKEADRIRSSTGAAKAAERIVAAFAAGLKRGLIGA